MIASLGMVSLASLAQLPSNRLLLIHYNLLGSALCVVLIPRKCVRWGLHRLEMINNRRMMMLLVLLVVV